MAGAIALSSNEHGRATQTATDAADLILAGAFMADGAAEDATRARVVAQSRDFVDRLDKILLLDLADRVGEEAFIAAVRDLAPPNVRASLDATIVRGGGFLPLVRNRLERIGPDAESALFDDTSFGCALGVIAIVAGVAINGVAGGFTAVVGIVAVAAWC